MGGWDQGLGNWGNKTINCTLKMLTRFALPRSVVSKLVSWTGLHTCMVDTRFIEWCHTVWANGEIIVKNWNSNLYKCSHIIVFNLFVCVYLFVVYCACWREQGWVCIMGGNVNQVALRAGYFAISVRDCGFHQQKKNNKQKQQQKNDNGGCFHYHAYVLP